MRAAVQATDDTTIKYVLKMRDLAARKAFTHPVLSDCIGKGEERESTRESREANMSRWMQGYVAPPELPPVGSRRPWVWMDEHLLACFCQLLRIRVGLPRGGIYRHTIHTYIIYRCIDLAERR